MLALSALWGHARRSALGVVGTTTLALPLVVGAQAAAPSDSSPFRAGQYGVEFGLGGNFAGLGFLRFRSPEQAWLFDVAGGFTRSTGDRVFAFSTLPGDLQSITIPEDVTTAELTARVGRRRYRPLSSRVQRFHTLGALTRVRRDEIASGNILGATPPTRSTTLSGGLFGEIGAAWMVTPNLSLGATWNADVTYSRVSTRGSDGSPNTVLDESTRSQIGLAFGRIGLRGNFYF